MFVTSVSEPSYRKAEKPQSVQQGCKPGAAPEAQLGSQHSSSGLSDGKEDRIPCLCSRQRRGMQAVKAPSCKEAIPSQGFPGCVRDAEPGPGRGCCCSDLPPEREFRHRVLMDGDKPPATPTRKPTCWTQGKTHQITENRVPLRSTFLHMRSQQFSVGTEIQYLWMYAGFKAQNILAFSRQAWILPKVKYFTPSS